jgi:hypothetical protein
LQTISPSSPKNQSKMAKESDLSEFEQLRLENIRRNAAFLTQLGLQPLQPAQVKTEAMKEKKVVAKAARSAKPPASPLVLRRSTRLSGDKFSPGEEATSADTKVAVVEEDGVNYEHIPEVASLPLQKFILSIHSNTAWWKHCCPAGIA